MSEFKIDKGVPLPRSGDKYRLLDLEVGDSIFYEIESMPHISYISIVGRRSGRNFTRRACSENGVRGFRVWRTK